jgi:hypothetical protein
LVSAGYAPRAGLARGRTEKARMSRDEQRTIGRIDTQAVDVNRTRIIDHGRIVPGVVSLTAARAEHTCCRGRN